MKRNLVILIYPKFEVKKFGKNFAELSTTKLSKSAELDAT